MRFNSEFKKNLAKNTEVTGQIRLRTPKEIKNSWQPVRLINEYGTKNYDTALWLAVLFGLFGFDQFYLGNYVRGIFKLLSFGGLMILNFIDIDRLVRQEMTDSKGKHLLYERQVLSQTSVSRGTYLVGIFIYMLVLFSVWFAFLGLLAWLR